ncbi:MAG: L-threonylcarbamoyladenylate synthase [Thermodesulfobacteriota bacterium]|nr:L-threonylcarbamoyladenylate synthase [Thermodesulfobacteriota bacterium]
MLITRSERTPNYVGSRMEKAAEAILSGGTVVIGTETFYALAANPFIDKAVERVFYAKRRAFSKPLPLIAANQEFVTSKITNVSQSTRILMKTFWPGSLTILLEARNGFSKYVLNDSGHIGVRVPPECLARCLSSLTGGWITATSANLTGFSPPRNVSEIPDEIMEVVDVVVDSGPCPGGLPSTVIAASGSRLKILRAGAIPEGDIVKILSEEGLG